MATPMNATELAGAGSAVIATTGAFIGVVNAATGADPSNGWIAAIVAAIGAAVAILVNGYGAILKARRDSEVADLKDELARMQRRYNDIVEENVDLRKTKECPRE